MGNGWRPGLVWKIGFVWICCLARLAFYSTMMPLWEGFDEWSHFAVVRDVSHGDWPPDRAKPVPPDVAQSLALAPVPSELRFLAGPAVTEDAFWALPEVERARRQTAFAGLYDDPAAAPLPPGNELTAYEALQPPLYYWMLAPVLRLLNHATLGTQVMALRWLSALIASLTIPLVFLIGRAVFSDERLALSCAAMVAVMPEFAFDAARVGNDCLAIALFTGFTWMLVANRREGPLCLAFGLLSKAYFLTAIPVAAAWFWREKRRRLALAVCPLLIAGWWYVRNVITTGTVSGLSESVMLRGTSFGAMLRKAAAVPWMRAIDSILLTHLYYGGWSPLGVRSWMYHIFYLLIGLAVIGLFRGLFRPPRDSRIVWLAAIYGAFWLGQLYNVVLLFASKGVPTSMGWYLYAAIGAEAVLCVAGLLQFTRWAAAGGVFLFAALDLYGMHVKAIPYYTGMIHHNANGSLPGVNPADWNFGAFARLAIFKGPLVSGPLALGLWLAYLLATVALVAWIAAQTWRRGPPRKLCPPDK